MSTAELPPTAYVPVGSEFEEGRPLGNRSRFNGERSARRGWWWQSGPLDSCCFCFSLRTGVGILSAVDFLAAAWALYFVYLLKWMNTMLEANKDVVLHEPQCMKMSGAEAARCNEYIEQLVQDGFALAAIMSYGAAAFFLAAGTTGLWAVVSCNLRPATLHVWTWLSAAIVRLLLLSMLGWVLGWKSLLIPLVDIYHFKVVRSYRQVLARGGYRAPSPGSTQNEGPRLELSSFP
ncbi:unnamed protein product [Pylaiella littoralis]